MNRKAEQSPELLEELRLHIRECIEPIASPDVIQYASELPKMKSGKITRRLLKRIATDVVDNLGDISSLADPSIIAELIEGKKHSLRLSLFFMNVRISLNLKGETSLLKKVLTMVGCGCRYRGIEFFLAKTSEENFNILKWLVLL